MIKKSFGILTLFAASFVLATAQEACADGLSLNVAIDTSALGQSGSSEIFFVLTDGNSGGPGGNTAVMNNFSFGTAGSGGVIDPASTFGSVTTGTTLANGATMTSDQFTNEVGGFFTAGSQVSFLLNLTTNLASGAGPDLFSLYLADPSGNPVGSSDPTGFDSLLTINIDSTNPAVNAYSSILSASPVGPVATPDPGTLLLLASGLAGLGALKRFRTRVVPED